MEISIYGCEPDEAAAFRELAPRFGVSVAITDAPLCPANVPRGRGVRCISIGHKTPVRRGTLRALRDAGVTYLSSRSSGFDHVDVDVARELGITVEGVQYSPDSVADYTLMLMLMAARNARAVLAAAETHDFRLHPARGRELRDLTVGVVGTGRIGAAVVRRLGAFGCRVLAHDRSPKTPAEYVSLDEVLRRSDIVTLHTPLSAETEHLLDRERLADMKPGALIVNTGRGALIDTDALLDALECGRLGGAALDVIEGEEDVFYVDRRDRPVESARLLRLHRLPNVLLTPHTAFYTDRALHDTVQNTIRNCLEFEGRPHA